MTTIPEYDPTEPPSLDDVASFPPLVPCAGFQLETAELIGIGSVGKIFSVVAKGRKRVVLKLPNNNTRNAAEAVAKEISHFQHLRGCRHIVRLHGVACFTATDVRKINDAAAVNGRHLTTMGDNRNYQSCIAPVLEHWDASLEQYLKDRCQHKSGIPLHTIFLVVFSIARGLQEMSAALNVVHADLCPRNVLVKYVSSTSGRAGDPENDTRRRCYPAASSSQASNDATIERVCITDFNLVEPVGKRLSAQVRDLRTKGSYPYNSEDDTLVQKSDVFSLGFVLRSMLNTNRTIAPGKDVFDRGDDAVLKFVLERAADAMMTRVPTERPSLRECVEIGLTGLHHLQ